MKNSTKVMNSWMLSDITHSFHSTFQLRHHFYWFYLVIVMRFFFFFAHLRASSLRFNKDIVIYTPLSEWLFDTAFPGLGAGSFTSRFFVPSVVTFILVAVAEGDRQRGLVAYDKLGHRGRISSARSCVFFPPCLLSQPVEIHHATQVLHKSLIRWCRLRKKKQHAFKT